jgi:hypothetical protein
VARIPEGIYRELLIDRLAREVRMPGPRLAQLLALPEGGPPARGSAAPALRPPVRQAASGRGSLISQAIARVLQFPSTAAVIEEPEALRATGDRGLEVLAELIETAQSDPHLTPAQFVERWRDRPEHARLEELAALPLPELEASAIGRELAGAVARLVADAGPGRRLDELIARAETTDLDDDEKRELQDLQRRPRPPANPAG